MQNREIVAKIEDAKDGFGVVTADNAHKELSGLSAADWQQAALIYKQDSSNPDGFYISDTPDGKVLIHNDMTKAHAAADNTVWNETLGDVKSIGEWAAASAGVVAASYGVVGWMESSSGLLSAAAGAEALGAAGTALAYGGAIAAVGAAAAVGIDYVHNYNQQGAAQADIRTSSDVTINSR